ncbi:hypothetical protein Mal65_25030 [Crateriforma conspicua]|nr:hypothetical protein Mal65_25030 [Crateriforma conspicua]
MPVMTDRTILPQPMQIFAMNTRRLLPLQILLLIGLVLGSPLRADGWTFAELKTRQIDSDPRFVWKQVAPGMAGSNRRIHTDSVDSDKVWVTPDMGNDYLTIDGGLHWESVIPPDGVWGRRQELSDVCVASDPKDPSVVVSLRYVGQWARPSQRIEVSTDGGRRFHPITKYASGREPDSPWYTAVAHPAERGTWYVANGIDVAEIRTAASPNPIERIDASAAKVWKITQITSDDRTITAIPNDGMDDATSVFDLLCHPDVDRYPDMLFAATSTGVYRRDDATSPWTRILSGCCKMDANWDGSTFRLCVLQQATYAVAGQTIASSGGVFITPSPQTATTQTGWIDKTSDLRVDLKALQIPINRFRSFVKFWFDFENGEEAKIQLPKSYFPNFNEILCDPTNPDRLFLANGTRPNFVSIVTGAIWASNNGGDSWFAASRLGTGFQKDAYWAQRQPERLNRNIDPQVHDNKYPDSYKYDIRGCRTAAIAADGTVFASVDKGYYTVKYDFDADQWISVDNTQVGEVYFGHGNGDLGAYAVVPDIHRRGQMFLLQQEESVWKTTDQTHPDFPGVPGVRGLPGLVDHGPSWAPGMPYIAPTTLAQHPSDPDVFYFFSPRRGNFCKSTDHGQSFAINGEPIVVPDETALRDMVYWRNLRVTKDAIYAVAEVVDADNFPMGQTRIYSQTARKGIYKSTDDGVSWTCVNRGLPVTAAGRINGKAVGNDSVCVKGLVVAPDDDRVLYAAAKRYQAPGKGFTDGGLYRTSDGASSWTAEAIPPGIRSLWDVYLHVEDDRATKILIAGGGDGDVADWGEGGVWIADYKPNGGYRPDDWTMIFDHPFCAQVATSLRSVQWVLVATRETSSINNLNQGTYITATGGAAGDGSDWFKINLGRGPMPLSDIAFDSGKPDRIWCSAAASGSYCLDLRRDRSESSPQNQR